MSEEDRIAKHLTKAQGNPVASQEQLQVQERLKQTGQDRVEVRLVNSVNNNVVMEKEVVELNKGRIPLKSLMEKWRITEPYWLDLDVEIACMPDGYSDCTFAGVKVITIKGKV
eukprot:TRINITY_DN5690_c0_g1_i1.p2 TRINITY_DN5690_c0_g1~~TRINITY_DN5690_c0_g1_i1.p2  ORF type:complete len:113 (+),score=54.88 TRINITY_DN5690_c0_g1_i1:20-358(+)